MISDSSECSLPTMPHLAHLSLTNGKISLNALRVIIVAAPILRTLDLKQIQLTTELDKNGKEANIMPMPPDRADTLKKLRVRLHNRLDVEIGQVLVAGLYKLGIVVGLYK